MTEIHVRPPPHRYPTRYSLSQAQRLKDKAKDQVLVPCKRKKEESHTLYLLPTEIIFNILLYIPAKVLHEVVRYVCKQWYHIVSDPCFVKAHRQLSFAGLLIQDPRELHVYYVEEDTAELKVTDIKFPFPARVFGSCNGLVLLHDTTNQQIFHVMNPVTKVKISLPPVVAFDDFFPSTGFALNSSGHYKVVLVSGELWSVEVQMRVFTLGVDKAWRFIDLQGIPMNSAVKRSLMSPPCFIAGLIYWFSSTFFCFAMDVDTETIYQFSGPGGLVVDNRRVSFLNMGTCLGVMKEEGCVWRLWKLTDVKSGEWTKVAEINIRVVQNKVDKIFYPSKCKDSWPLRLIDGYFWFYRRVDGEFVVVRYNLANESFVFFPIKTVFSCTVLHPHVHTLLSPKNC